MRRLFLLLLLGGAAAVYGQQTFTVWHYESSAVAASWNRALELFKQLHPGVRVEVVVKTFEEVQSTADRILSAEVVPDVMEFNKGNANAGYFSSRGAFRDLTAEAVKRGWDKLLPESIQTTARYDARGLMGSGSWFGVPTYGEFVLIYYNKTLFRQAGRGVPATRAEFEADLEAFRSKGIIPLSLAAGGSPAQHLLYELFLENSTREDVLDYQMYRRPVDLKQGAWRSAAETFVAWARAGYFSPSAASLTNATMLEEFAGGKSAAMLGGSWLYPMLLASGTAVDWGTFPFPGNRLHPGSSGHLWVLPVRGQHPEWALEFIDLTLRRDVQTALANAGGIAVNADRSKITNPRGAELNQSFDRIMKQNGLAFYPDWPAVGYYDSLFTATRDLLRGVPVPKVLEGLELAYQTKKGGR